MVPLALRFNKLSYLFCTTDKQYTIRINTRREKKSVYNRLKPSAKIGWYTSIIASVVPPFFHLFGLLRMRMLALYSKTFQYARRNYLAWSKKNHKSKHGKAQNGNWTTRIIALAKIFLNNISCLPFFSSPPSLSRAHFHSLFLSFLLLFSLYYLYSAHPVFIFFFLSFVAPKHLAKDESSKTQTETGKKTL